MQAIDPCRRGYKSNSGCTQKNLPLYVSGGCVLAKVAQRRRREPSFECKGQFGFNIDQESQLALILNDI